MVIDINYEKAKAKVTYALNFRTGDELGYKYIKEVLQRESRRDGWYGLHFYHIQNPSRKLGELEFEIQDSRGRIGKAKDKLEEGAEYGTVSKHIPDGRT